MNPPLLFTEHFNCIQLEDQHEDISKLSLLMLNGCRRQLVTFFLVHRLFLCIPLVTGQLCSRELLRWHGFGPHEKLGWESKGCFSAISGTVHVSYCAIIHSNCYESTLWTPQKSTNQETCSQQFKVRWLGHQSFIQLPTTASCIHDSFLTYFSSHIHAHCIKLKKKSIRALRYQRRSL